jgi:hypothetical protein
MRTIVRWAASRVRILFCLRIVSLGMRCQQGFASICIALTACTNVGSELPSKPATQPTLAEDAAMPHDRTVPAPLLENVLTDAQQRTGVARSQLEIISTEKVTWNDGALGCPQPDRMYTQAVVPGYRIRVRAIDQTLDYHAAETGRFVLCTP